MFSNVQSYVYWSGTEYVPSITGAWRVYCAEGFPGSGVTLTARLWRVGAFDPIAGPPEAIPGSPAWRV